MCAVLFFFYFLVQEARPDRSALGKACWYPLLKFRSKPCRLSRLFFFTPCGYPKKLLPPSMEHPIGAIQSAWQPLSRLCLEVGQLCGSLIVDAELSLCLELHHRTRFLMRASWPELCSITTFGEGWLFFRVTLLASASSLLAFPLTSCIKLNVTLALAQLPDRLQGLRCVVTHICAPGEANRLLSCQLFHDCRHDQKLAMNRFAPTSPSLCVTIPMSLVRSWGCRRSEILFDKIRSDHATARLLLHHDMVDGSK